MRLVERLWSALEERPRLRGVRQEIKDSLGPDYELAVPFLRASGREATRYACPFPSGPGCPRRIVKDPDGSIHAVCGCTPKECDPVTASSDDIKILRFDDSRFARTLQRQLGISGEHVCEANGDLITLGTIKPAAGKRLPVVLMMAVSCQDADALTARTERKYRQGVVLLTPTDQYIDPETEGRFGAGLTWLVLADLLHADSNGLTAKSQLVDVVALRAASARRQADVVTTEDRVFRKEGQIWTLTFDRKPVSMRDTKGLLYICQLLRCPGQPIQAPELMAAAAGRSVGSIVMGSAGAVLDDIAISNYRRRLGEIESELGEAEGNSDLGRKEALVDEKEQINVRLVSAVGLGGRRRRANDDAERVRKSVSIAISRAITAIRKHHRPLADHLQRLIDRGQQPSYAGDGIPWNF